MTLQTPVKYLSATDAAAYICVHPQTLRRYVREGRIGALKLGKTVRYRIADLDALVESGGKQIPAGGLAEGPKQRRSAGALN